MEDRLIGSSRDRRRGRKSGNEREREGDGEGEARVPFGEALLFASLSRAPRTYKAPSLARVYIRLGSGVKERERETREDGKAEEDFIFGSPMTFASSRERRGTAGVPARGAEEEDGEKMKTT